MSNFFRPAAHRNAYLEDFNQGVAAIEELPSRLYSTDELLTVLRGAMNPYLAALWRINLLFAGLRPRTHFSKAEVLKLLQEFGVSFEEELSPPGGRWTRG